MADADSALDQAWLRPIRLQKLLAQAGAGSRRYCEALIRSGRVAVGGKPVVEMGMLVYPDAYIEVDGAPVGLAGSKHQLSDNRSLDDQSIIILLNKPCGIISSAKDQFGRKSVVDLIGNDINKRIYPVGRLDYSTSGLILLTNDGDFAYRATHPKFGVDKVYEAICGRPPSPAEVKRMREGVELVDGFHTSPARIYEHRDDDRKLTMVLREGKNRQVRKMLEAVGNSVISLKRVAIGCLMLGDLAAGNWRIISADEAKMVFQPFPAPQ